MTYNTKQKDLILNVVKSKNKGFTIKEIQDESNVGLTTIYRLVDKLVDQGIIRKEIDNTYIYLNECECSNHFYLKCEKCLNMIHVDCDCINGLTNHINNKHKFKIDKNNIVINGICENCMEEV